ncbi:MAG TPA: hypothetical protein VN861_13300 [Candidatus Acidoferrales bacterium]|nr:hypothetical protein [Candidatus Acidoferrales bacterium]
MKIHPFAVIGALLVAAGIAALIHPSLSMPSRKNEIQIGSVKTIVETTRIIQIPGVFGVLLIIAGGSLIFLSTRKQ